MKTNFWKRAAALLLALVLCFACVGTASAAEDVSGKVYLISYPRDGDENYHTGSWGHDALYFRHGWKLSASDYLDVRAIGSYDANICYCIEPGVIQNTGDAFSRMGEDFWENMSDFNDLMKPQQMKRYIGRIMTYGYTGGVSTQWRSQNAGGDKLAQAYATQILIWETVAGERDADFRYVASTDADAVREVIRDTHPLREKIFAHYDAIVSNVQKHTKVPSFCAKNLREARTVTLEWNGSSYSAELLDTNEVLENYTFAADDPDVQCAIASNRLILTTGNAPTAPVTLTAEKKNSARCGVITWTDGQFGIGSGLQDLVTYAETVNDPVVGYLKVEAGQGSVKIVKTSEDGKIAGISFTVTGSNFNETVTTDENGELQLNDLVPGAYTVTENAAAFYEPQQPQTVTVKAGQTAEVSFSNQLKRGALEVTKTAEDGFVQGVTFRLSGTADCGQPVDEYAKTDENGLAVFEKIPIGSNYTLAEAGVPERYVEVPPQNVRIAWNEVTKQTVENRLVHGSIRGIKVGEADKPLPGAVFGLFAEGTMEFLENAAFAVAESSEDGSFSFENIPYGVWLVRELEAPAGYVLSDEIFEVQITENSSVIELGNLENKPITGSICGIKVGKADKPLPGAVFGLFAEGTTEFLENAAFAVAESSEDGSFSFENIPYGMWLVRELEAPAGYVLSGEIFEVRITGNDVVIELGNLENKPVTGELELTKLDVSTGKPLPNAGFRIKDTEGNTVVEGYTDEHGIARFTLGYGEYTYEEFATPEGYLLDTTPHAFSISEDGQIVKAEMMNERIPTPEIPQTGDSSNLTLWLGLGGIALGALAACGILYFKRKKDEK